MCKSCQKCWEDFYWNCIEEKFCYDESIANYNPADDEYFNNSANGLKPQKNNGSAPIITVQPSGGHHTIERQNSKIHEDDYRQVQTTCPILATEILKVFSNSQIFHENQSHKKTLGLPGVHSSSNLKAIKISGSSASPGITTSGGGGAGGRESDNEKLLIRLEGKNGASGTDNITSDSTKKIHFTIDGYSDDTSPYSSLNSITSNSTSFSNGKVQPNIDGLHSGGFSVIREEEDENGEIILKPQNILPQDSDNCNELPPMNHKHLRNVQSVPQFIFRPASENDIYSISGGGGGGGVGGVSGVGSTRRMNYMSQISMTPEIPSISYSTLPKNYETTPPRLDKYIDTPSLYSIQLENTARILEQDLSMPRFFGKSDKIGGHHSLDQLLLMNRNIQQKKHVEVKSKRLEAMRTKLPPLTLHRDRSLKDHHHNHQQQQPQQHGSQKHGSQKHH